MTISSFDEEPKGYDNQTTNTSRRIDSHVVLNIDLIVRKIFEETHWWPGGT